MKNKLLVVLALLLVSTSGTAGQAQVLPDVTTFIKTYANFISNGQADVTPEDVQATSDGGYILLGSSSAPNGVLVSWLVKIDSSGNQQWVKELGVFNPAVSYAIGVSLQQTHDGGYIIAGGTLGGGSMGPCSPQVDAPCALVQKLNSSGDLEWASVYFGGAQGSQLSQIRQTFDGGYVAVGGTSFAEGLYGALILRLDKLGNVVWQKVLGPHGSTLDTFTKVLQTPDGGFATLGYTFVPQDGPGIESVLVAKYTAAGALQWQSAYNDPNGHQAPFSFAQTSDGGYIIAGSTSSGVPYGYSGANALLLKLGPRGNIQWQKAYSAFDCLGNHLGEVFNSVHQTADGGYVLAGDGGLIVPCGSSIVPWMAKVDSSGNLLWEHLYYQTHNGLPLSEYFASATLTPDGGILAIGSTEDYQAQRLLLYVVKTDSAGLCSSGCNEVNPAIQATAIDISLKPMLPILPLNTKVTPSVSSPSQTQVTTVVVKQDCD